MGSERAATANTPLVNLTMAAAVKKTDILKPELAIPYKSSTKNVLMTPLILTNASAVLTLYLVLLLCKE